MQVRDVLTLFAVGALVANAATVLLVISRLSGFGSTARRWVSSHNGELAALITVTATFGSLYLSEVAHLIPCRYCWFQRVAMYPLALILVIALISRDRGVRKYAVPLAAVGLALSTWHYLLQNFPSLEDASACNILNPCTVKYTWKFGFVSIPYMAGSVSLLTLVLLWERSRQSRIS
ncbi:MAG: disulfide bond formation protein B [Actinomycetota bacterium]|jgi:disulfide bond formation protein DsbB|nr:disulfide bond formation protein B [Actinomycetota bacterium]